MLGGLLLFPFDRAEEILRAYREIGFEGVLRPDHVPTMEGEDNRHPGYEAMGRLFAIGYIKGLREAAYRD